jgi:hypothetical protein
MRDADCDGRTRRSIGLRPVGGPQQAGGLCYAAPARVLECEDATSHDS